MLKTLRKKLEEKETKRKEILAQEKELSKKMGEIEVFPGTLEEFERLKNETYEIIDLPEPRKFVEGGRTEWEELHREEYKPIIKLPIPYIGYPWITYLMFGSYPRVYYSGMLAQAAEVGAEAVVKYTHQIFRMYEMGIPVRRKNI